MKKKIIIIVPHLSTGGLPQFVVKKIDLLKESYDIKCVEYSCISYDYVVQKRRIISLIGDNNLITLGENKGEILDFIDTFSPDFIWMEEFPEFFMSHEIAREIYKKDRKYIIFESTHDSSFKKHSKVWLPDKFIFVSLHNALTFYTLGIPYEIIEYPIDKSIKSKEESRKKLSLEDDWKHVVNVGLFTERKNQKYVFDVARKMEDMKIKFHFLGNQADNFRYYWEPLMKDKPDNCIIWGERDDVDDFLSAADLFFFASRGDRNNKELNPISIKEAIEYDLPVLLFDLDVYCGKYSENKNIHFLNGDAASDAKKISDVLNIMEKTYDAISILYERVDNRITFVNSTSNTFKYSIVIKDMLSNHTIYWFDTTFHPGSSSWCIPCPPNHFFGIVANANNFKGYVIDFYDENRENLIFSRDILVDEYATNFSPTLYQNPFNSSFMNYTEFFGKKYLDDYNMTDLDVFIDAGANDGLVTEWALNRGFKKIYCVEPDPRAISILKKKFIDDDRVVIIEKAIYKDNKTGVRFETNPDASTVTSMNVDGNKEMSPDGGYFLSETIRFNKLANDYNLQSISVFKIDIEGAEYDVIRDIDQFWVEKTKHFLIELHHVNKERMDLIVEFFGKNFHMEFRNHLSDNSRISLDDARKLEMVTLFATNKNLVPDFIEDHKIEISIINLIPPDLDSETPEYLESSEFDSYRKIIKDDTGYEILDGEEPYSDREELRSVISLNKNYNLYRYHLDAIMSCLPMKNTAYVFLEGAWNTSLGNKISRSKITQSYSISRKNGYNFFSYSEPEEIEYNMGNHLTSRKFSPDRMYMITGEKIGDIQKIIKENEFNSFDELLVRGMPSQRFGYFDQSRLAI